MPTSIGYPLATITDHRKSFGDFVFKMFFARAKPKFEVALKRPSSDISAINDFAKKQIHKFFMVSSLD